PARPRLAFRGHNAGPMSRAQRLALVGIAATTAAAGVLRYAVSPGVLPFLIAALALAGLAWLVSFGTEAVGARFGPAVTGFLQSTLGNLPELFVVIFALSAGEVVVAQTSIIGSLLANALLVLGLVIVVGARSAKDGVMRFHPRLPNDTATLLLVSTFIIVIAALSVASSDKASTHIKAISGLVIVAIAGNAVENFVGLVMARRQNWDLAISVVKNSVAQIAAFLFPALVLVSLLFSHTLSFQLAPVYVGALFFTAIAV